MSKEILKLENSSLKNAFGTILIDECHHVPAESYRNTIQQFNSYYLYGLTATAFRKYNDEKLEGIEFFHIVLETLDTEEATYLWHFEKSAGTLSSKLKEIDRHLDIIRKQGRQLFLTAPPENFSRIIHDYSNEQKGFIWKDMLEERLV